MVYDPSVGVFFQRDPAGYVDGMSVYQYERGNPIKSADSNGLSTWGGLDGSSLLPVNSSLPADSFTQVYSGFGSQLPSVNGSAITYGLLSTAPLLFGVQPGNVTIGNDLGNNQNQCKLICSSVPIFLHGSPTENCGRLQIILSNYDLNTSDSGSDNSIGTRIGGVLQVIWGFSEMVAGGGAFVAGVLGEGPSFGASSLLVAGGFAGFGHGVDDTFTGVDVAINGVPKHTNTYRTAERFIGPYGATAVDMALSMVGPVVLSGTTRIFSAGIAGETAAAVGESMAPVRGSSELEALYLQRASSPVFQAKLEVSNQAAGLVGGRVVSASEITEALANTEFRQAGLLSSSVNQSGSGFIINGSARGGYFAGEVADHELLHIGQFIRNPSISQGFPVGLVHEVVPSFVGSPVIYVGGTTVIVGGAYGVYRLTGDSK